MNSHISDGHVVFFFLQHCLHLQPNHPQAMANLGNIYMEWYVVLFLTSYYIHSINTYGNFEQEYDGSCFLIIPSYFDCDDRAICAFQQPCVNLQTTGSWLHAPFVNLQSLLNSF